MKIEISPAHVRAVDEALSHLAAADQWRAVLDAAGIDTTAEADRISANRKIATGIRQKISELQGNPTL